MAISFLDYYVYGTLVHVLSKMVLSCLEVDDLQVSKLFIQVFLYTEDPILRSLQWYRKSHEFPISFITIGILVRRQLFHYVWTFYYTYYVHRELWGELVAFCNNQRYLSYISDSHICTWTCKIGLKRKFEKIPITSIHCRCCSIQSPHRISPGKSGPGRITPDKLNEAEKYTNVREAWDCNWVFADFSKHGKLRQETDVRGC